MKRVSILVSATAMTASALFAGQGCSSDEADRDVESLMGTGGTTPVGAAGSVATPAAGAGGAAATGGTSPAPSGAAGTEGAPPLAPPAANGGANAGAGAAGATGGMAVDGETGGAAGAAMGMGGSAGIPVPPPEAACAGSPANNGACVVTCTDDCGVFAIGTRLCTCNSSIFSCASCGFEGVDDPLIVPPTEPLPPCDLIDDDQEDDNSGCVENERCQSIGRADPNANFANRFCACRAGAWDCDTKPAGFP